MLNVILTLVGIILGIAATALVGRYYFRRTIERALTPFIHLHSFVLSGIDPEVREDLKILFRDQPVDDLTHLQLLVANTGTRAIRDCIKPFTVLFPKDVDILDHAILHRYPRELELTARRQKADESRREAVQIDFPLLNRGDFFLLKFLLKGTLKTSDIDCRITVDDLPPTLDVSWLPPSATRKELAKKVDWSAFWAGLGLLGAAASIVYTFFLLWRTQPSLLPFPWSSYEFSVINSVVFVFSTAAVLFFAFLGIMLVTGIAFEELFSSPRHKFQLPEGLQPSYRFRFSPGEIIERASVEPENDEGESSNKSGAGDGK